MSELDGLRGISNEVGSKLFDPMELAQWAPVDHLRKAELANGRTAMLAVVGWWWPQIVGTFDGPVTTTDPIKAILASSPQWWAQFVILCGVGEFIKYQGELGGKSYSHDGPACVDWSGQWETFSDEQKEDISLKELKNGRLAMLGIASFIAQYYIPGSVPWLGDVA